MTQNHDAAAATEAEVFSPAQLELAASEQSIDANGGIVNGDIIAAQFNRHRMTCMLTMAKQFAASGAMRPDINNLEKVFVILQTGFEMGMKPMESINSFYIVKGAVKPFASFWPRRLRQFGWQIQYDDKNGADGKPESCTVTISHQKNGKKSFTAHKKDIPSKSQAINFAPFEKLRYHALSRIVQFEVPEIMSSVVLLTDEDMPPAVTEIPKAENGMAGFKKAESPPPAQLQPQAEKPPEPPAGGKSEPPSAPDTTAQKPSAPAPAPAAPAAAPPRQQQKTIQAQEVKPATSPKAAPATPAPAPAEPPAAPPPAAASKANVERPSGRVYLLMQQLGMPPKSETAETYLFLHTDKRTVEDLDQAESLKLIEQLEADIKKCGFANG